MFDHELQALRAIVVIDVQAVYGADGGGQRVVVRKQNGVQAFSLAAQFQSQVFFSYHALFFDAELPAETGLGKTLSPYFAP
jgi:hypothetical protein